MNAVEHIQLTVCSAHAEVIPGQMANLQVQQSLLRTRGGDPVFGTERGISHASAPHTRR